MIIRSRLIIIQDFPRVLFNCQSAFSTAQYQSLCGVHILKTSAQMICAAEVSASGVPALMVSWKAPVSDPGCLIYPV